MDFRTQLLKSWQRVNLLTLILLPFSLVYRLLFRLRKMAYQTGLLNRYRAPIPIVVVGNITVGGTGKTPMVIYLVELLQKSGFKPGVISRGYSGVADAYPLSVSSLTPVKQSGDEPALILQRTNAPIVVGPDRKKSIQQLMAEFDVDVIISDDGLQHLAMQRDIEICLQDSTQTSNNRYLLPAGPYRESQTRLQSVDMIVQHQYDNDLAVRSNDYVMQLQADAPQPLMAHSEQSWSPDQRVHAVAGIGNPARFFTTCRSMGLDIIEHSFSDHHHFSHHDIEFEDDLPVLMTEKDAVKCRGFAKRQHWYLPVNAKLNNNFDERLLSLLEAKTQTTQ